MKILIITIQSLFLLFFLNVSAEALNSQLQDLPDNTWIKLEPQMTERFYPKLATCPGEKVTSRNPASRSYSGITAGDGRVFYFGGGHQSHNGNDMEIYDVATNNWTQPYAPECCGDSTDPGMSCKSINQGSGTDELSLQGRPLVEHTYQYLAYDSKRHRLFGRLDAGTWAFDPGSNEWIYLAGQYAGSPSDFSPTCNAEESVITYDKTLDRFVAVVGSGSQASEKKIWVFDPNTNVWTYMTPKPSGFSMNEPVGAYDENSKTHIFISDNSPSRVRRYWKYSLESNQMIELINVPSELSQTGKKTGIAYDTLNKVTVVAHGGSGGGVDIWIFNVIEDTWAKIPKKSTSPSDSGMHGPVKWSNFDYDPVNNVFFYLNSRDYGSRTTGGNPVNTEFWAYRYASGSPPPTDTTPPTIPQGLSANPASESEMDLLWNASIDPESGISKYMIYRNGVNIGQTSATFFSDTGLLEDTSYDYQISAINGAGWESDKCEVVSGTTLVDTIRPSPPENLKRKTL